MEGTAFKKKKKSEFNLLFQVDTAEVWESLFATGKKLLKAETGSGEESRAWNNFLLEHWERTRVDHRVEDKFKLTPSQGRNVLEEKLVDI